jgi:hypothetical protein
MHAVVTDLRLSPDTVEPRPAGTTECGQVGDRPKHQAKEIEALMREAEARGWVFTKGQRYFKGKCSCAGKHMKTIKLTPSDPNYLLNTRKWLERQSCWKD